MRITDEAKIAEEILDFGALIKAESADHGVADVVAAEGFLNETRLRVGAVKDCDPSGVLGFGGTIKRKNA